MTAAELRTHLDDLERAAGLLQHAVHGLSAATLRFKPSPEKWCIAEILAHLADIEILYGYRLRQILADRNPTIAPIDQDDWARNLRYIDIPPEESLALFRANRRANVRLLRGLSDADLARSAYHPELKGPVTAADLVGRMIGHVPNHLAQIERLKQQARGAAQA